MHSLAGLGGGFSQVRKERTQITWPLRATLVSLTICFEMTETSVVLMVWKCLFFVECPSTFSYTNSKMLFISTGHKSLEEVVFPLGAVITSLLVQSKIKNTKKNSKERLLKGWLTSSLHLCLWRFIFLLAKETGWQIHIDLCKLTGKKYFKSLLFFRIGNSAARKCKHQVCWTLRKSTPWACWHCQTAEDLQRDQFSPLLWLWKIIALCKGLKGWSC